MSKRVIEIREFSGSEGNLVITADKKTLLDIAVACIEVANGMNAAEIHADEIEVDYHSGIKQLMVVEYVP